MQRKVVAVLGVFLLIGLVAASYGGTKSSWDFKGGEEAYVCNCGIECPCNTISNNPGKCTCGKDMVKAKVTKADGKTAFFKTEGWKDERPFKTEGKYACACNPSCPCNTVSQNPGKCTCNVDMKQVQ